MNLSINKRVRAIVNLGFIILLSFFLRQVHAQPAIKLDPEYLSLAPIGVDPNTKTIERVISVTNTGTEILKLDVAGSTCGCVSSAMTETNIEPGEKGTIKIHIDFKKLVSGAKTQTQRIIFSTNDPNRQYVNFEVIFRDERNRKDVSIGLQNR